MARYAWSIFLGAFLLFQVQPVIGKYILPWFGGTSAVWTTCMLFFQLLLLVGYAYAHLIGTWFRKVRGWPHLALLGLSLLALPIMPDADTWRPDPNVAPTLQILGLLLVTIGFPYLLLSSTGPLLQRWFSLSHPGRSPYRLYALSNVGSLLALLSYPFLVEPFVSRQLQVISWSWAYVAFVAASAWCAWSVRGLEPAAELELTTVLASASADRPVTKIGGRRIVFWLALTASASAMLLATTNQLTLDIASVPFLWILPLSIYLLSFIICFDGEHWYKRPVFGALLLLSVPAVCYALEQEVGMDMITQIVIYAFALFACCMTCHGELVRDKPDPGHLTLFYLVVAAGGALGGVFVAVLAPLLFSGLWEFHVALVSCVACTLVGWGRAALQARAQGTIHNARAPALGLAAATVALAVVAYFLNGHARSYNDEVIAQSRNFYGVLRVKEKGVERRGWRRMMMHGNIRHGMQYMAEDRRGLAVDYYGPKTGIALAMRHHPRRAHESLKVAVVGLGAGTLAIFSRAGDDFRFFELDPEVQRLAQAYFTYLDDAKGRVSVTLGDGRIQLENALAAGEAGTYDLIALDAFSSDSVPIHLLTREAAELYRQLLKPDGLLLFHITNRFVNLTQVMVGLARDKDVALAMVVNKESKYVSSTRWAVFGRRGNAFFEDPAVEDELWFWNGEDDAGLSWTDDYASLLQVLR